MFLLTVSVLGQIDLGKKTFKLLNYILKGARGVA